MLPATCARATVAALLWAIALSACTALPPPPGIGADGGVQEDGPPTLVKDLYVACGSNLTETFQTLPWELSVNPTVIESGQTFTATFNGIARFDEELLDIAQAVIPGGVREVQMLDFRATVVPYEGATGPHVVLTHEPIEPACAEENPIGMRPACDPANDVVTAVGPYANRDCEPQRTDNPCGRFIALPTSDDCSKGGTCWDVGRDEAGPVCPEDDFCKEQAKNQCEQNAFCITGGLQVPLGSAVEEYRADMTGEVRFGWYQRIPWDFPVSDFGKPATQVGLRYYVGRVKVAFDCVASDDQTFSPPLSSDVIAFSIDEPTCADSGPVCPAGFALADDKRCRLTTMGSLFTAEDPSGTGSCAAPADDFLRSSLPVSDTRILGSPSLLVRATVDAENVDDSDCTSSSTIIATVQYADRQSTEVTTDAIVFNDPSGVSVSAAEPEIRETEIYLLPSVGWSTSPEVCCERSFQTTFTVSVAQCEGWAE